jgi:hypothetical protein
MYRTLAATLGLATLCHTVHGADVLFAIDSGGNRLVSVDVGTGAITDIGHIDSGPGYLLDLAAINTHLYGLVWNPDVDSRLIEISTADATVLSSVPITVDGVPSIHATEAITATTNGSLLLSLWRPGAPSTSSSNNIGTLRMDGTVTGIINYGADADFDGLGLDPNGDIVGLNREPGPDYVALLNVSYEKGTSTTIISIAFSPTFNQVDDVVVIGGDIITLDASTHRINRHDRITGAVTSFVPYSAAWTLYAGLAVVSVPDACFADLDGDHLVGATDLAILLGEWGGAGAADLDADGTVAAADLAVLLGAWGPCP